MSSVHIIVWSAKRWSEELWDGVGFNAPAFGGAPGEHIGLSIMEERARRIGAELRIESEVGEGTRVEILFVPQRRLVRNAPEAA